MQKNWALSDEQCWLQALQFLVHLIDLLSILLRCNGFARIQKAVVDQTGSRTHQTVAMTFFWCKFGCKGLPGGSAGRELPAMQETWVQSLSWEDPLEKGMATHCSVLAWRISWTV